MVKENERFFDSFEYSEAEFAEYMGRMRITGVERLSYDALNVIAPGGMQVQVLKGFASVEGFQYSLTTPTNLVIDPNGDDVVRRDYVVLRLQRNLNNFVLTILKGTPSPTADPPDIERSFSYYDLVIAYIDVPIGASSITSGMIHDTRPDMQLCGWAGYGVFYDFLALLGDNYDVPGVAFASNGSSGMGYDNRVGRIMFYVSGAKPLILSNTVVMSYQPFYAHYEPSFSNETYRGALPLSALSGVTPKTSTLVYQSQVQAWDRRFQLVLGRSVISTLDSITDRHSLGQWAFRVGGNSDGNAKAALEIFDLNRVADLASGSSTVRPDASFGTGLASGASAVPFGIDVNGRIFLNYLYGAASGGAAYFHRATIGSPINNESALHINNRTLLATTFNTISLVAKINTPPSPAQDGWPTVKRAPVAPNGASGLVYGDGNFGSGPVSGTFFFIGPEGAIANSIVMDNVGYVGIGMTPAVSFDVKNAARFGSTVNIIGILAGDNTGTGVPERPAPLTIGGYSHFTAQDSIQTDGHVKIGAVQDAHEISLEVMQDAIFYGDVNIRGRLTFGSGGGGEVTFPFDMTVGGKLTVIGNGWFKAALQVDGDLDVYGNVRFHKAASATGWEFDVVGNTRIAGRFRVISPAEMISGQLYFGDVNSSTPRINAASGGYMDMLGSTAVRLIQISSGKLCIWDGDWNGDISNSGLGHNGSRWDRAWLIHPPSVSQPNTLSQLSVTQSMIVDEADGTTSVLPGPEMIGLRPYTPQEGLLAALATPVAAYFVSNASNIVMEENPERKQRLLESDGSFHLNVMPEGAPPEFSGPEGGIDTMTVTLVALSAVQALAQMNQDLEARLADLERFVATLASPDQA